MSRQTYLCAAALAILAAAAPLFRAEDREADRRAIREHIDSIFEAYIAGDAETLRATHSKDWCGYLSQSLTMMDGVEAYMAYAQPILSNPSRISAHEFVELEIRFHGDVALIPYVARITIDVEGGQPISAMLRCLDVYEKRHGEWVQIGSNLSTHATSDAERRQLPTPVDPALREEILSARAQVWRAVFSNDRAVLDRTIPDELVAIDSTDSLFASRDDVLEFSASFIEAGGELTHLEFPETVIQLYWDVAILYTTYELEFLVEGERSTSTGRGTEIFVRRDGTWVNVGWHLDDGNPEAEDAASGH